MQRTGRYWEFVGSGIIVAAGAIVFARPLLLVGALGVWVWLLLHQLRFTHYVAVVSGNLKVSQSVSESTITTGETVTIQLVVDCSDAAPCPISLTSLPPFAATAPTERERTVRLDTAEHRAETEYDVTLDVAGRTALRGIELCLCDPQGLFAHTWEWTSDECQPIIDVRPYGPRDIHIGRGKESFGRGYGEHETEHSGSGIEPLGLREYVPGDSLSRIDWKATARLAEPYIREYEATTDRQTLLVIDHRNGMDIGDSRRTMLDHARSVGIAVVASAQRLSDPLGWLTIGDGGITDFVRCKSTPDQYQRARRAIETLEPTAPQTHDSNTTPSDGPHGEDTTPQSWTTDRDPKSSPVMKTGGTNILAATSTSELPTTAEERRHIARLLSDDSAFATQLRPFFADTTEYLHRISGEPLFQGTRFGSQRVAGTTWFVIVTSDQQPTELLETVRTAQKGGNHVLVFLTPRVLFDTDGPDNLGQAYERYRAFEQLRQRLEQYPRVTAFEVGPRDQLATVLTGASASDGRPDQRDSTPEP